MEIGEGEGKKKSEVSADIVKLGQNFCMKNKWISVDKEQRMKRIVE